MFKEPTMDRAPPDPSQYDKDGTKAHIDMNKSVPRDQIHHPNNRMQRPPKVPFSLVNVTDIKKKFDTEKGAL